MLYALIICIVIIIILVIQLNKKQKLDKRKLRALQQEYQQTEEDYHKLEANYNAKRQSLQELSHTYEEAVNSRAKEIDAYCANYERLKKDTLNQKLSELERAQELQINLAQQQTEAAIQSARESREELEQEIAARRQEYESLIAPIKQLEKEKSERLFYTIQTPEEYRPDIDFLLTTVAAKVNHPDIISKLVWQEYVKPYLDDTCKRVEIENNPGIYKLTCLSDEKCYIGKSTDVKKRIQDHFKSVVGIKSIADQAVHHAILETGLWNWTIEILCYCDKDELSDKEKFYIDTFKSQEYGYNKKAGG